MPSVTWSRTARSAWRCEPVPQRHADRAVRDHVTEGIDPGLGGVEAREPESPGLRDVNGADGCGRGRNRLPAPEALEDAAAGVAQRRGPFVEARLPRRPERGALYEQQPHAGSGEAGGETRTDHAATDDGHVDIEGLHAAAPRAMSASI